MNDHFGSGDTQTQSINNEAEMQEQPRADDVDAEERDVFTVALMSLKESSIVPPYIYVFSIYYCSFLS